MPYELNTRKLVWIWFSNDPNQALNFENQERLKTLRAENPDATISLIYARTLLTTKATLNLLSFCKRHNIIPVSMEKKVIPNCKTKEEIDLITVYEREISTSLSEGGCLAAAADYMRWLKPIYERGIYCEPDTPFSTKSLPEKVLVNAPILTNTGSVELPIKGLPQKSELELIILNTDILAIVGDDEETRELVKKVQRALYEASHGTHAYSRANYQLARDVWEYVGRQLGSIVGLNTASAYVNSLSEAKLADQLFLGLGAKAANPLSLRKSILAEQKSGLGAFCKRQLELLKPGLTATIPECDEQDFIDIYLSVKSSIEGKPATQEDIQSELQAQLNRLYINSVTHISGPINVTLTLFNHVALPSKEIDQTVMPFSFSSYPILANVFTSNNSSKPHTACEQLEREKSGPNSVEINDQSWTDAGAQRRVVREQNLAACTIQRFFRQHKTKEQHAENPSNTNQVTSIALS